MTSFTTQYVDVRGYRIACYIAGEGEETILCLNGGPGLPCDYMRDPHLPLIEAGYRVVAFDQLGTGASDKPDDPALWTIDRYVDEVEAVRMGLNLGKVHLAGHSWGGWLSVEYCAYHANNLKSLILQNTCADIPHLRTELMRLREALGSETQAMMLAHEAAGTYDHPEYQAAITLLNFRHVCRLREWPAPVRSSLDRPNGVIYNTMQGPNEFLYTGNLRDWERLDVLRALDLPILIMVGQHDEITTACAARMRAAAPHAEIAVFPNSAHMPFHEEPEAFLSMLGDFLDRQKA